MTGYVEPLPGCYDASDPFWRHPAAIRHHRGSDWNGVPAGTVFQIATSGVVVVNEWNQALGWLLGVRGDDGLFMGYAHQEERSPHRVGTRVTIRQGGGEVGDTGSASEGDHLHTSLGTTIGAIFGIEPLFDPAGYIHANLAATAGGTTTPIKNEENMPFIIRTKQHGHYTVAPGCVIAHPTTAVTDSIGYRDWATIMDVAPDDLAPFLFDLGGCPADQIPAPGTVWYGTPNRA